MEAHSGRQASADRQPPRRWHLGEELKAEHELHAQPREGHWSRANRKWHESSASSAPATKRETKMWQEMSSEEESRTGEESEAFIRGDECREEVSGK